MKSSFLKQLVPRSPVPCTSLRVDIRGSSASPRAVLVPDCSSRKSCPSQTSNPDEGWFHCGCRRGTSCCDPFHFLLGRVHFRKALLISLRFKGGNSNPAMLFLHFPNPPGWDFSTFPLSGVGFSYGTAKAASGVYFSWEFVLWPWSAQG